MRLKKVAVLLAISLLDIPLHAQTQSKGTCILSAHVTECTDNSRTNSDSREFKPYHLAFVVDSVSAGSGNGQCEKVTRTAFDSADATTHFSKGQSIEIELACHGLGNSHGCEITNVDSAASAPSISGLAAPAGASRAKMGKNPKLQTFEMQDVSEVRQNATGLWVAGKARTIQDIEGNLLAPDGNHWRENQFEITMPINAPCKGLLKEGKLPRPIILSGVGQHAWTNKVEAVKFSSIPTCAQK